MSLTHGNIKELGRMPKRHANGLGFCRNVHDKHDEQIYIMYSYLTSQKVKLLAWTMGLKRKGGIGASCVWMVLPIGLLSIRCLVVIILFINFHNAGRWPMLRPNANIILLESCYTKSCYTHYIPQESLESIVSPCLIISDSWIHPHVSTKGAQPQPGFPNCCVHWISLMMEPTKHRNLQSRSKFLLEIRVYVYIMFVNICVHHSAKALHFDHVIFKSFCTYPKVNWHT